jgi:cellulose synthase/poly-beta-1,6-N-acetylglucosamine synthase-like glycosyltransferase
VITLQIVASLVYAAVVTALFALLVPGYLLWLWWGRGRAPSTSAGSTPLTSAFDVLVPVQDEAAIIASKLDDLAALASPREHVRFLVVDGASTDGTWERVQARAADDPRFVAVRLGVADKTRQLNAGLQHCRAPWVVVTDADARLPADALLRLAASAAADPDAAVLGTEVVPTRAHAVERLHWRIANLVRRLESARGATSVVAGPCYAFRRSLLAQFPADVVADDAHVALAAAASGARVVVADLCVTEQRSPVRLLDMLRHKRRKTDAYLREIFRFLPLLGAMPAPARAVLVWRAAQLTVLPVCVALAVLGTVLASSQALPLGLAFVLPTVAALVGWGLGRSASPLLFAAHGVVLSLVTLATLVAYPFSRQTAALPKVPARPGG